MEKLGGCLSKRNRMKNLVKQSRIKLWELATILGVYCILSLFYYVTLWINSASYNQTRKDLLSFYNWFNDGGLQYIIMLFATALIWFVIFRLFRPWKLVHRLLLHILGLPLFVLAAQQGYYFICDQLDMFYLSGVGQIWDIYIPSLIYLIQFSIFHAYEYYVVNQRKLKVEIELKNAALKSELNALKAQTNPHFLYNVFNTINASVPPEMEKTREMIAGLSDLFRYQLKASQEDEVTLGEELEFVKQYLALEKLRFEDRLEVSISVQEELSGEKIPPMILQPLVENSVKHGISPLVEGGKIEISITKENEKLYFELSDTGVGIKDKNGIFKKGIGLGNTQLRLQKLYNSNIELIDNQPKGLKIRFSL